MTTDTYGGKNTGMCQWIGSMMRFIWNCVNLMVISTHQVKWWTRRLRSDASLDSGLVGLDG